MTKLSIDQTPAIKDRLQLFGLPRSHALRDGVAHWGESIDAMRQTINELTGLPIDAVTDDADLLDLGMDSLTVIRIAALMRREGCQVEYRDLLERPTPAAWWGILRARSTEAGSGASTAVTVDESAPFPLAPMQHAFWVGRAPTQELGGVSAHFYTEFDNEHGLNVERFERALHALVARHDMLRVVVQPDGLQRVTEHGQWPGLVVNDLRSLSTQVSAERLQQIRDKFSHRVMDLSAGEVFDAQVSLLSDNHFRIHLDVDMVAADALSLRTLLTDLVALYEHGPDVLTDIEYSYARYLAERTESRKTARDEARAWWLDQLPHLPSAPALPLHTRDDPTTGPTVTRRHHWLRPEQVSLLRERARREGLTVSSVLATVFAETIGSWSATDHFLLNMPVFDREPLHDYVDQLVGDFSSSVLLDADVSSDMSITECGQALQERLRLALSHASYNGIEVLRDLSRANGGQRVLAPVVYTSALGLGELYDRDVRRCLGTPCWFISQGPQVWMDVQVTEFDGGILLNWDVRESLFPDGMFEAMFGAYIGLVELLLNDEQSWHRSVPSQVPRAQLARRDETVPADAAAPAQLLHERFFARAASDPNRIALVAGTNESISYGQLSLAARRMASLLADRGIGRGDSVGITLPKGVDQVVVTLGVLAAGATYVPSGVDVPAARRAQIYRTVGLRLVVTDPATAAASQWPANVETVVPDDARLYEPIQDVVPVDPEDVMYVIFTSGSTGEPKGAQVPHRAVANTVDAVNDWFDIGEADRTIALSALDFDLSAYDMFAFLGYGGSVVVVPESQRRDAAAWAELIRRWDVTVVSAVPALLDMLLVAGAESGLGDTLRVVMLGGDRVTVDLPGRLRRLIPGCRFAGLGGMTEAAIHATVCEVDDVDPDWGTVPYGTPLRNVRCRVVDGRGRDRPDWVPGELWVTGAGLAHGYCADPVRTAEKFVEDGDRRWYRTGDLVRYRPDGTLEFLGRTDHQVKIRGHRIELGEVEAVLAEHPRVESAVAAVVEHATRQLVAAMVLDGPPIADDELRAWLAERLPSYMVPTRLMHVAKLPITRNGKIDRAAVQTAFAVRRRDESSDEGSPQRPTGPVEQAVASAWTDLLGVECVSRTDDFFALGGDSLLATRLIRQLRSDGLAGADLAHLFTTPTLQGFAATLRPGNTEQTTAIRPDTEHRHAPFELTDVQRAFWIGRAETMELGGVGSYFYLEFDGAEVDLDRLEAAWNRLVARHEMLRAVVTPDGAQHILPSVPYYRIERVEAGRHPETTLHRLREKLSHHVVDVEQWPLFSIRAATYTSAGTTQTRLFVGFDSIIADGRSIMLLYTEWDQLYRDPHVTLRPIEVSFRDYVQQVHPDPQRAERAKEYWAQRVRQLPPAPRLPLARWPREIGRPRFQRLHHVVEPETWRRITDTARSHGLTPSTVLLTCYVQLLGAWSDQRELTVNVTLFDRQDTQPSVERVVGDFASLLLLGYSLDTDEGFVDAARRLQRQQGRDLAHREATGIWVLRELARHAESSSAAMPVVFTSVLGVADDAASLELSGSFPEQVYGVTQTPQVWLDNKVASSRGGITIDWDVVEELFCADIVDAMFDGYVDLVEGLAGRDWFDPLPEPLTPDQRELHDRALRTARTLTGGGTIAEAAFGTAGAAVSGPAVADRIATGGAVNHVEDTVARLWQELLDVPHVQRTDNFFDLGGDSIIATRLMSRLRAEGLAGAQLARLFTHPVMHEFASTITIGTPAGAPSRLEPDPAHRHDPFPLTDIQVAYWLGRSEHFDLGGIGAQLYVEYEWPELDLGRLQRAWNRLINRHGMLRAVVGDDGTQRVLVEVPEYRIPVIEADDDDDFELTVGTLREEMSHTTLDASTWPLFDVRVVREVSGRARVCVTFDNLTTDGLSTLVVIAEWIRLYADPDADLPAPGIEFRDYVLGCAPSADEVEAALSYWRDRLAELPPGPQLPLRVSPSTVERPRFHRREVRLDRGTWQKITIRGREHGLTPSVLLLACYISVLGGWSAQRDLSVTLTQFDRRDIHPDINRVVGDFTSLLLVADHPTDGESWLERARRLQKQVWRDLDHQQVSAVRVLRELAKENAALAEPIPVVFTSMLGVDDELVRSVRWPDHTRSQTPQVWLDHQVIELPDGLLLSWDSVDELFPDGMVEDMLEAYRSRLVWLSDSDWELPLPDLLPPSQRAVRDRVNDTAGALPDQVPGAGLLHGAFFEVATATPERTALIDGDTVVSFGELADHSKRIAALLTDHGARPGDAVAVIARRGAAQVAALLGVLAVGAAYVPVAMDQPPRRRHAILGRAGVSVLLTDDPSHVDDLGPHRPTVVDIADARRHAPVEVHHGSTTDLAYVIFTSGSTGDPKGVEVIHGSAVNTLDDLRCRYGVGPTDRVLAVAAIDFDLSVFDLFGVLGAGGSVVLIGDHNRRDPQSWLHLAHLHGVTLWNSVPAMLDMLLTVAEGGRGLPPSLRLALASGDWVGLDLPGRLATQSDHCRLVALGGATEAAIWSNAFEVDAVHPEWASIPYGYPLRNQCYRVVDEAGHDRPDWAVGELWIGGTGVARGYRGEPELTAAKFLERGGTRWYRTGDLGRYWPDGTLEFLGRADRQVKIRGHRIELGEIETAIAAHPQVRRAIVVAVGERGSARLVAFVEPRNDDHGTGADPTGSAPALPVDLSGFLAERLPSSWIPELMALHDPPLTANGKIDHTALARRAQPVVADADNLEPLRPGLEEQLGQVWAGLLGSTPAHRYTNFFGAGGDSLSATRLVQRLERELGITVSLREFFTAPTIAGLAETTATVPQPNTDSTDFEEGSL